MKTADGKSIRDVAMADMAAERSSTPAEPSPEHSSGIPDRPSRDAGTGDAGGEGRQTVGAPEGGAPVQDVQPKPKEYFYKGPDGKKYKMEVNEDGEVVSKDLAPVLQDPYDHFDRHHKSTYDRMTARERERIRKEELGNFQTEFAALKKDLATMRQGAPAAQTPPPPPEQGAVDWTKVDRDDPVAVFEALRKEASYDAKKEAQAIYDKIEAKDRYIATKALKEAAAEWQGYDSEMTVFYQILRDEGVVFGANGPDWSKVPPHVVKDIADGSRTTLQELKATDERISAGINEAISLMPVEFDEHLKGLVEMGFREAMRKGRPFATPQDCKTIAYGVAKQVLENDNKRTMGRVSAIKKAYEASKGKTQTVETEVETPPPQDGDMANLSSKERHRRIRERGKRDRMV